MRTSTSFEWSTGWSAWVLALRLRWRRVKSFVSVLGFTARAALPSAGVSSSKLRFWSTLAPTGRRDAKWARRSAEEVKAGEVGTELRAEVEGSRVRSSAAQSCSALRLSATLVKSAPLPPLTCEWSARLVRPTCVQARSSEGTSSQQRAAVWPSLGSIEWVEREVALAQMLMRGARRELKWPMRSEQSGCSAACRGAREEAARRRWRRLMRK